MAPSQRSVGFPMRGMNLARVDLVSIRLVVLCAEFGSLSSAARRANMSVAAASRRLASLEDSVKTLLFERDHRGLQVTVAGAVFVGHAQTLLQVLYRLDDQLVSMAGRGTLADNASPAIVKHQIRPSSAGKRGFVDLPGPVPKFVFDA